MSAEMTPAGDDRLFVTFVVAHPTVLNPDVQLCILSLDGTMLAEMTPTSSATISLPRAALTFRFGVPENAPRFELASGIQGTSASVTMKWDGRRWTSDNAIPLDYPNFSPTQLSESGASSPVQALGFFGLLIGLAWLVYAFNLDVTVCTGWGSWYNGGCVGGSEVINLDLAHRQQMHFLAAGLLTLCSLLAALFGGLRNPKSA